ncbi:hypothetical protein C6P46_002288 [Rhodotorula mucilaginosa]|uniref:Transcriptional regulator of RNA polII, SAGA, subunit-domain-containing protein n=1 Tax=Rhodotorula mucilaginosa TaxID=5537 RepID=A0A9P6W648_RHOMI|nr:hypothetical protein C6P46_002288 [Rhodotorula mucilaginosa]
MASEAIPTAAAPPVASTSQLGVVSVPSLLPSPTSPPSRRTDLVSLKLRLAELLTPEQGTLYWSGLADFFTGRINRNEWDDIMKRAFGRDRTKRQQALKLHNALVLSIVYNTTRPYLPPTSIRHSGFHPRGSKKRARDPPPTELEEKRKRLLKDAVMALGRRERGEVKLLGATSGGVASAAGTTGAGSGQVKTKGQMMAAADEERKRKRRAAEALSEAVGGTSRGGGGSVTADGVPTSLLASGKDPATLSAIATEFHRIQQAPLCCEARLLPDGDTLHDRMLAVAYEEGLASGVEGRAAVLLSDAMEHHLQDMIASVISLVRGTRRAVPQPPRTAASSMAATPIPSTFAPAGAAPAAPSPAAAGSSLDESAAPPHGETDKPVDDGGDNDNDDAGQRLPLTIADFHALFAISPALLGQYPNIAAVERMYAIAPPDSDSDSDDYDSEDAGETSSGAQQQRVTAAGGQRRVTIDASAKKEEAASAAVSAASSATTNTGVGAGKHPRLSRSRASSFYGISRPVPVSSPATTIAAVAAAGHPPGGAGGAVGKGRFVIDPSSTHGVPEGHPSVPPLPSTPQALLLPSWLGGSGGGGGANGPGGVGANASSASNASLALAPAAGGPELSPKSIALRNSLFPELAQAHAGATAASGTPAAADAAGPDGNWTSTDAGDSDSDDEGKKAAAAAAAGGGGAANSARSRHPPAPPTTTSSAAGASGTGLKIKFGGGAVQGGQQQQLQQTGPSGQRLSASAQGAGSAATDRETGRKLWEVVDSVGLLDGVLPP